MKFFKSSFFKKKFPILILCLVGIPIFTTAQKMDENISTVVIDSAPKKLYS